MKRGAAARSQRQRLDLLRSRRASASFCVSALLAARSACSASRRSIFTRCRSSRWPRWLGFGARAASAGQALALGFGFGLGYFLTGTSWVYVSMHDFGGMPLPIAGFRYGCSSALYLALLPGGQRVVVRANAGAHAWVKFVRRVSGGMEPDGMDARLDLHRLSVARLSAIRSRRPDRCRDSPPCSAATASRLLAAASAGLLVLAHPATRCCAAAERGASGCCERHASCAVAL